jgi:hypothetical protein
MGKSTYYALRFLDAYIRGFVSYSYNILTMGGLSDPCLSIAPLPLEAFRVLFEGTGGNLQLFPASCISLPQFPAAWTSVADLGEAFHGAARSFYLLELQL